MKVFALFYRLWNEFWKHEQVYPQWRSSFLDALRTCWVTKQVTIDRAHILWPYMFLHLGNLCKYSPFSYCNRLGFWAWLMNKCSVICCFFAALSRFQTRLDTPLFLVDVAELVIAHPNSFSSGCLQLLPCQPSGCWVNDNQPWHCRKAFCNSLGFTRSINIPTRISTTCTSSLLDLVMTNFPSDLSCSSSPLHWIFW